MTEQTKDPTNDPKAAEAKAKAEAEAKAKAEADAKAKADAESSKAKAWTPKVGGACCAVFMRGGPVFVERAAKIVALGKDGTATVEYQNDRGKPARLELVPYVERGTLYSFACWTSPIP